MTAEGSVVALSGGIGGAKLALGLLHCLPADRLTIVANTGDDFEHLGLSISPDIDTLLYVLSDRDDPVRGWGRRDETWHFMEALREIGSEDWFLLGDRDLALHVERTRRLRAGEPLTEVTALMARRFGIGPRIMPMSDDPVRTRVETDEGWLDFQPWFVGRRAEPRVRSLRFEGAAQARLRPELAERLASPDLRAIVICPSNPLISIDPILAVPGIREALAASAAPVVAVSPLIGGRAVKGPTADMMRDLGMQPGVEAIARHYGSLVDGLVIDDEDRAAAASLSPLRLAVVATLMRTLDDRIRVARTTLDLADAIEAARR